MSTFTSLGKVIQSYSQRSDKGITFIKSEKEAEFIAYRDLYDDALRLLYCLQSEGAIPGDEVVFQLNEPHEFVPMFWACVLGGMVPVPVAVGNNREHRQKPFRIWSILQRPFLVTTTRTLQHLNKFAINSEYEQHMREMNSRKLLIDEIQVGSENKHGIVHNSRPEDIALIQFSSGSTGDPKGVILTHNNLLVNIEGILDSDPNRWADDLFLSWMPLTHDLGLIGLHLAPLTAGMNHILLPTELFIRNPLIWFQLTVEYKATVLSSPNFGFKYVLDFLKSAEISWDLSSIRKIINGAEPISWEVCERFLQTLRPFGLKESVILPAYGLAEASVGATLPARDQGVTAVYVDRASLEVGASVKTTGSQERKAVAFIDLGKPIKGTKLRICDNQDTELPEGHLGRIQICGGNVTQGYYQNEEATRKMITADGWVDTGDLGFLRDERLIVTGRAKDIIFVNGQNLYPHDIERVAEEVEGIDLGKVAACSVYNQDHYKEDILLFVIHRYESESFAPLAVALKKHLNLQMGIDIRDVIPVKMIPKTTSGKFQRYLLAERFQTGEFKEIVKQMQVLEEELFQKRSILAPIDETEVSIIRLWKEILSIDKVSTDDHFFELGGNSLKASVLVQRMHKELLVNVPLTELFRMPTVSTLAAFVRQAEKIEYAPIRQVEEEGRFPVTSAQKRMFIVNQYSGIDTAYHVSFAVIFEGTLDNEQFDSTWKKLVNSESVFRTTFHAEDGEIVQQIHGYSEFSVNYEELNNNESPAEVLRQWIQRFDLGKAPLLRVGVYSYSGQKHLILIDTHHIVADRSSLSLILQRFSSKYNGEQARHSYLQYKDYAVWHYHGQHNERTARQREYWLDQLQGELPTLDGLTDYPRPAMQSFEGEELTFELSPELTQEAERLATANGTTLYAVLFTAYVILLHKYSSQNDIIVGAPTTGRTHADINDMLGMFVNTLPIRCKLTRDQSLTELLRDVSQTLLQAYENQDFPMEAILEEVSLPRDTGRNPLFDTVFLFQNMEEAHWSLSGGTTTPCELPSGYSKFDLTLEAVPYGKGLRFRVEYAVRLFEASTIERLAGHYLHVLQQLIQNIGRIVSQVDILRSEEKQLVVEHYNDTAAAYPEEATLHGLFEEQADKAPEAVAVVYEDRSLTYRELDEQANRLAWELREAGVRPGQYVGIMLNRSPAMVVSVLAVLKAGGAYVPLDPALPAARMQTIAAATKLKLLVTESEYAQQAEALQQQAGLTRFWYMDRCEAGDAVRAAERPPAVAQPGDIAYTIFTSGSTGVPKGVVVAHRPVVNLITWVNRTFAVGPSDRVLFITSLSFDLSVYDMFGLLAAGGSIRIVDSADVRNPEKLMRMLLEEPITFWDSAPAALNQLESFFAMAGERKGESRLRLAFLSGDWIPLGLPGALKRAFPGVEPVGLGGATEAAVWSNYYRIGELDPSWVSIPYGRPIANARYYMLNADRQPCPVGVPGDLYIGGDCLALGYIGDPELTERKFVPDPFSGKSGARMYHTGDRARWKADGQMEFLGRIDHQVKIRGYRIELGEIQAALMKHPDVKTAVAIVREDGDEKTLCAYLVAERSVPVPELREFLAQELPGYMIPAHIMALESLPVTPNGKLDLKALPAPTGSGSGGAYEAPRNETEEALAAVWREVLRVEQVGIYDHFFSLGGDSIKAIQVMSRLRKYGLKLEMKDFFEHPMIAHLSGYVRKQWGTADQAAVEGEAELTPVQRWFQEAYGLEVHFNQAFLLHSRNGFNEEAVRRTFEKLTGHHDALRQVLATGEDGRAILQHRSIVWPGYRMETVDLRGSADEEAAVEAEASRLQSGFNLTEGPLVQLGLLRTTQGDHLLIAAHHLVIDGVSWRILLEDFASGYAQAQSGKEIELEPKTHAYRNWSEGLQGYAQSTELLREMTYWRKLEEGPVAPLPKEGHVEISCQGDSRTVSVTLGLERTEQLLKDAGRAYTADMDVLLLTALGLTMQEWKGLSEMVVQLEGHGREAILPDLDISRTIGWFTAAYPVRLPLSYRDDLGHQIKTVKEALRQVPNKGVGYGLLRYVTPPERKEGLALGLNPEISFNYLGQFDMAAGFGGQTVSVSPLSPGRMVGETAKRPFVWNINALIQEGQLTVLFDYNIQEFSAETMKGINAGFKRHLDRIIDHCLQQFSTEVTPSDLIYNDFDLEELDQFVAEIAADLKMD